jgi:hypothetical protein
MVKKSSMNTVVRIDKNGCKSSDFAVKVSTGLKSSMNGADSSLTGAIQHPAGIKTKPQGQ